MRTNNYALVQIIRSDGEKLQPAFDDLNISLLMYSGVIISKEKISLIENIANNYIKNK